MNKKFSVEFLTEAVAFIDSLEKKEQEKIIYSIDKSQYSSDPKLFKKIDSEIWEFRTRYNKKQFRLLAFWDKRDNIKTLVIATSGFIKTTTKIPKKEIGKARNLMKDYFDDES